MALFAPPSEGISAAGSSGTTVDAAIMATAVLAKKVAFFRLDCSSIARSICCIASSPGTRKSDCDVGKAALYAAIMIGGTRPQTPLNRWIDPASLNRQVTMPRVTRTAFAALTDATTIWFRILSQIQTQRAASHQSIS